jgi:RimJ/RimL family protein N-acetyltransferase
LEIDDLALRINYNPGYCEFSATQEDPHIHIIVARKGDGDIIGFHWISVDDQHKDTVARIHSLWVEPGYRRRGIARELKTLGEAWMREQGAVRVTTEVFYVNKEMIDLNIKLGFTPWQVELTKDL